MRSSTLSSVAVAMLRSCDGDSSRSKISTSAPRCMERITSSWSLPLPMQNRPSSLSRFCRTTSTTARPAVSARRSSSARLRRALRGCLSVMPTRIALSLSATSCRPGLRANWASRSRMKTPQSSLQPCTAGTSSTRQTSPASGGSRWAYWIGPGRPSSCTNTVMTASRRSSARSVRSSSDRPSGRSELCTRRTPRKRAAPARERPRSGRKTRWASPTMTLSITPCRSMRRPMRRPVSRDSSVRLRARGGEMNAVRGTRRR